MPHNDGDVRVVLLLGLLPMALVAAAIGGYLYAQDGQDSGLQVTVREGAPALDDGIDAVLTVDAQLIADSVVATLETSDLPVRLDGLAVHPVREGLAVTANTVVGVGGAKIAGRFATTAVPRVTDTGTVGITLMDTTIEGIRVPSDLETRLASLISDVVADEVRVPGYEIRRIETSMQAYTIFFARSEPRH